MNPFDRLCHDHLMPRIRRTAASLVGRRARLRWVYLILGGAVLMPYFFLALLLTQWLGSRSSLSNTSLLLQFAAFGCALPLVAATAFFPAVRTLEIAAARVLLGGPVADLTPGPATSASTRYRSALWYVLHLATGGIISGMTLAVPPFAVYLAVLPFLSGQPDVADGLWFTEPYDVLAPFAGVAMLAALVAVAAGCGALLARLAPVLLGPSPADRLAALERRAAGLAERNRLARELHDSVGHALSVVTLQASAAGRVMDRDPEFVRRALAAIEESTRTALDDLDHVLGLLREDRADAPSSTAPQATLIHLDRLLDRARDTGVEVHAAVTGDPVRLPPVVSREAYRIVQEGLTNALRHAGAVPVQLRIDVRPDLLVLELTNPVRPDGHGDEVDQVGPADPRRSSGGRGLPGIAERVAILGGRAHTGVVDGQWRILVEVPL